MEITIPIDDPSRQQAIFGPTDHHLRVIRAAFSVRITARADSIWISGDETDVRKAAQVIAAVQRELRYRPEISDGTLEEAILLAGNGTASALLVSSQTLDVFLSEANIVPRGPGQRRYLEAVVHHDLTFCVGPAGTGKTYLAVAFALTMLKRHEIKRIALVRPAVEAGEKLGFLPGDLQAKVNPYLRPIFDAMHDMMTFEQIRRFMQTDVIEIMPLGFMRGRTLNQAAIILDEAQNATVSQMLMVLTRLGESGKMIVTGDDSQSDLPKGEASGLKDALERLKGVPGVGVIRLHQSDIVRHPLVQRIVEAYSPDPGHQPPNGEVPSN